MMKTSEQLNELAPALAKAQAKISGAVKDSNNPFFRSKYADLASVWDAVRVPLTENGLSVVQSAGAAETGVTITTMLLHSSGQWISDTLNLVPKDSTPQGVGSAITYGRRYGLAAITGCAQVDDDGNAASGKAGVHDPRGDLVQSVDPEEVETYIRRVAATLAQDVDDSEKAPAIYEIHRELVDGDEGLYIAVADALAARKIIGKNGWKTMVREAQKTRVS